MQEIPMWFLLFLKCPDSVSKKDLEAYLQRIALYCHQLNITSKVKADVQSVSGELIVSGVSSITCLLLQRNVASYLMGYPLVVHILFEQMSPQKIW